MTTFHFQRTPSEVVTDAAVAAARAGASRRWVRLARRAVLYVARSSREGFTTEEVWAVLESERDGDPPERRALGAVMRSIKAEGRIVLTGSYRLSQRVESHRRPLSVWIDPQHNTTRSPQPDRLVDAYRLAQATLLEALRPGVDD